MLQYTTQLAQRLQSTFSQIENEESDTLKQLIGKKRCAEILIQELDVHVKKYRLIKTEAEQIIFYKKCLPVIAKWQIAANYLCEVEKDIRFGTPQQKIKFLKKCAKALVKQFKKKHC
jgi:hypothetical protein